MAAYPPQLPNETAKAYSAACEYFGMGGERSLRDVAQVLHKSLTVMARWSGQHTWVDRARLYDADVQNDIAQERTKRYLADLEDHRTRYQNAGRSIYGVAARLLQQFNKDIEHLELTPATLSIVLRAFTTGGDLEAHALNLDEIMPKLTGADDDRG